MDGVTAAFLEKGILGAIIVVEGGVIAFLYRENKAKDKIIYDLQNKLLEMAVAHATTDTEFANKIIETVRQLNELFSNKPNSRGK